jgi:hypothetical protein
MSEERMIRVAMEDEDVVLGFLTIADKWGHTRVVDIELEPVAPKDWTPICFQAEPKEGMVIVDTDGRMERLMAMKAPFYCPDCPSKEKCRVHRRYVKGE